MENGRFVGAIELRGSTRLRGRAENDAERLEDHGDGRGGPNVKRALVGRAEVGPQLVGGTSLVGLDQPAQHVEHLVRGEVNRQRLSDTRPRLGDVPLEDLVSVDMASPSSGLQVRYVGVEKFLRRPLGLLSFDRLLRVKAPPSSDLIAAEAVES